MMRQYELVERVNRYNPATDEALLNKAYVYAMQKHGMQMRASGDPYFSHPLEVAAILTDLRLDDATIAVALLHDTIEDTDATRAEIDHVFGEEIGKLVEGLTKISRLDLVSRQAKQAENFRKLLLAIADDVRVLLVKLADRLHNMRTLNFVPEEKRNRIAEETMEIYAPLAGRMGMQDMRSELEDLAFRTINAEAYKTITNRLESMSERNTPLIGNIERSLTERLAARNIETTVLGRQKLPYSIFRKMEQKKIAFEQLSDIFGFRVIVEDEATCYAVLGVVHTNWPAVPGRFKDYISTPKRNDYRSIHTTVVGPSHQRVELQIRSLEMDRIAEYGIAAHALYKDGVKGGRNIARLSDESRAYEWLRQTIDLLSQGDTPEEFLENTKLELFHDQVFCFTPKGRLIALPRGATPLDFAYSVHTDVGNTCVGVKINGKLVPLITELHNGDEVEIIRSGAQTPAEHWLSIAVTGKARAAIRRALREADREKYATLGRHILQRAFERRDLTLNDAAYAVALPHFSAHSVADLQAAVGHGDIHAVDVVKAVDPACMGERAANERGGESAPADRPLTERPASEDGWFDLAAGAGMKFRVPTGGGESGPLPISGLRGNLPVRFSEGGALPGERIVGILTPGEGVTVYQIYSKALQAFDNDQWLDVRWDVDRDNPERFPARISISAINEPGTLAGIAQIIGENDGNIDNIKMVRRAADFHEMSVDLEVWDLKHLNRIINQLGVASAVATVARLND